MTGNGNLIWIGLGLLAQSAYGQQPTNLDATSSVRTASQNRLSVSSAKARLNEAMKLKSAAGAYPLSRIEIANGTRPDVSGGEDLSFFQPLDVFGKYRANSAVGQAGVMLAESNLRQVLLDVQTDTLTAFATAISAQRLLRAALLQFDLATSLNDATRKRVEIQSVPELQLVRSGIELEKARQILADRTAAFESARVRLAGSIGIELVEGISESEVAPGKDSAPLSERPDILALQADLATARAEKRVSHLGLTPDFELQLRRAPWAGDQEQYGARLQMVLPLWDYGANRSKWQASNFHIQAAEAQLQDRLKLSKKQVDASWIDLNAAQRSSESFKKLVSSAELLLTKTQRGFELGASTLLDVIDARRALSDAQELYIAAQLRLDLAKISVLQTQGQLLVPVAP